MIKIILIMTFLMLFKVSVSAETQTFDLRKVAEALQFPYENLKVEDYLEAERGLYEAVEVHHRFKNYNPTAPENILLAYKITSDKPHTFFPIIITVVKEGSYYTPELLKSINYVSGLPEVSYIKGGRLPYGDIPISDQQKAFLGVGEVMLPSEPMQIPFDTPGAIQIPGGWPVLRPAIISYIQAANSDVEIRILIQQVFCDAKDLIKIAGGEVYYKNLSDFDGNVALSESDDPSVIILPKLFKALNEVVLDAPALAPYLKKEKVSNTPKNEEIKEIEKPTKTENNVTTSQVTKPQPKESSWLWLIGLIVLLSVLGLSAKYYFSKRSA
jgi:hypothetical protein